MSGYSYDEIVGFKNEDDALYAALGRHYMKDNTEWRMDGTAIAGYLLDMLQTLASEVYGHALMVSTFEDEPHASRIIELCKPYLPKSNSAEQDTNE